MATQPTIGTHDGTFHCDEALACFMLRLLPQFKDARIVRSRDPAVLDPCTVVVDVGGRFDPEKQRFDHHQRDFAHTMHSLDNTKRWKTKLSSAGLVYFHYGREVCMCVRVCVCVRVHVRACACVWVCVCAVKILYHWHCLKLVRPTGL